jgi:hypothetical protein
MNSARLCGVTVASAFSHTCGSVTAPSASVVSQRKLDSVSTSTPPAST